MLTRTTLRLLCTAIAVLAVSTAAGEDRWWDTGHAHMTAGAIPHLPQPLRAFFEANAERIATFSGVEPAGSHWIDIDYYPEFFAGTLPHDYDELVALYNEHIVQNNGTAPWNTAYYMDILTTNMAAADNDSRWLALRGPIAIVAHYVEDMHNPLHMTLNYNGQLTGNTGIHARYEGNMVVRHLAGDLPITPNPTSCHYLPWIVDSIFDEIDVNYWYVNDIMAADDLARAADPSYGETYYDVLWAETGGFTHQLFQDASEMVACAWYTAWIDAGAPMPLPAPFTRGDVNCDGVVNNFDIPPFVMALTDPDGYQAAYPACGHMLADVDADGLVTNFDVAPFLALLTGD
ncbi:MAG: hypothetical protein PVJ57_09340 [Phycisphaerae bacterium]|jgi:hypothetical protein